MARTLAEIAQLPNPQNVRCEMRSTCWRTGTEFLTHPVVGELLACDHCARDARRGTHH